MVKRGKSRPRVGTVVVHYGALSVTFRCLRSLDRLNYRPLDVFLADNTGLAFRYSEYLREFKRGIRLVPMGGNVGFARAVNAGIKRALASGCKYVWLLNNDAVAGRDSLRTLVSALERMPRAGIAGSRITDDAVPRRIWHAGGRIDMRTGFTRHAGSGVVDRGQFRKSSETDYVTGCSMLLRARMLKDIGLLDERFVMYYEETDLCIRGRKAGWKTVYVPQSDVCHCVAGRAERSDWDWLYYETRNRLLLLAKHNPRVLPAAVLRLLRWPLGSCLLRGRLRGAWNAVRGMISFAGILARGRG